MTKERLKITMKLSKKLNKNFIITLFKSMFCVFYLMLMISCKSGNITSSSLSSNNQENNQANTEIKNSNIPYNQDKTRKQGVPNGQDAKSDSTVPNGQDGKSDSKVPNGQDAESNSKVPNGQDGPTSNENTYQRSLTQPTKQKVDFLIATDKSLSMQENHKTFLESSHFQNLFSGSLEFIDWQMGFVNTYANSIYHHLDYLEDSNGLITMPGDNYIQILNQELNTSHNLIEVFKNTIYKGTQAFNQPHDTEEPLASIINTVQLPENNILFRSDAALVVVIISDEDETAKGGSQATMPAKVIQTIQSILGPSKQFSAYGIIIRPGDQQCLNTERTATAKISTVKSITNVTRVWVPEQAEEGPPCPKPYRPGYWIETTDIEQVEEHYTDGGGGSYGYFTTELAHLTGGITTSICNENYDSIISDIEKKFTANRISDKIELEHTNIIESTINVTFTPSSDAPNWEFSSQENAIIFDTHPAEGTQIQISYRYTATSE